MNDKANEYNSYIKSINSLINRVEHINFDCTYYKNKIDVIDDNVKKQINDSIKENKSIFDEAILIQIYTKAIKDLKLLQEKIIEEFDTYYKIVKVNDGIETYLKEFDENKIDEYVAYGINLLSLAENSSTVVYETEKNILNRVYDNIYQLLLKEANYSKEDNLLEKVKLYTSAKNYIASILEKDVTSLNNSLLNNLIFNRVNKNGIDYDILDSEIIKTFAAEQKNDNEQKKEFNPKIIDDIKQELKKRNNNIKEYAKTEVENNIATKYEIKKGISYVTALAGIVVINLAIGFNSKHSEYKLYKIETNVDNDEVNFEEEYVNEMFYEPQEYVVEKMPWVKSDNKYIRDINYYSYANDPVYYEALYNNHPDEYSNAVEASEKIGEILYFENSDVEYKEDVNFSTEDNQVSYYIHEERIDTNDSIKVKGASDSLLILLILLNIPIDPIIFALISYYFSVKKQEDDIQDVISLNPRYLIENKEKFKKLLSELKSYLDDRNLDINKNDKNKIKKLIKKYDEEV